jgi:hypothetical protein
MDNRPTPEDFDGFDEYCDALRTLKSLTPSEYCCLLQQDLDWAEESYGECYSQYRSECAMFGDAGPGQAIHVRDLAQSIADIKRRLARAKRVANA